MITYMNQDIPILSGRTSLREIMIKWRNILYFDIYQESGTIQMADYREMYRKLFQATTKAIDLLQTAQQETEELYISSEETELHLFTEKDLPSKPNENDE